MGKICKLAETRRNGWTIMTATFAIVLSLLSLGSCFASYQLGRDSMRQEIRDYQERKRRFEEFDED